MASLADLIVFEAKIIRLSQLLARESGDLDRLFFFFLDTRARFEIFEICTLLETREAWRPT